MTAPKPNTTNSGITASEAVVEITMESLEASNHPEAKAILALIASKVREARLDELSMLERAVERMSWGQYIEARKSSLAALQPREQDKV